MINKGVRVTVDTPTPKATKNKTKTVQHEYQDICSNFRFVGKNTNVLKILKTWLVAEAKPQYHYKSIGRQILLLVRGLKPNIDLPQGPNKTFRFLEFTNSIPCRS